MDFVAPLSKKRPPFPQGWQRNTFEATGDAFYLHVTSDCIVYKFDNMVKNYHAFTPSQAPSTASAAVELFPDNALSGAALVDVYATPHHFRDGSSSKPVMHDDVSEALSDLTSTQMTKKKPPKRQRDFSIQRNRRGW
jgi:hypothetical protein